MKRALIGVLLGTSWAAASLAAQVVAAVEAGGSRVDYSGSDGLSAWSLSPSVQWLGASSRLAAEGGLAQFSGGGWSLQGDGTASVLSPPAGPLRAELAGTAAGGTRDGGGETGELLGRARIHLLGSREGAWIGGMLGRGWNGLEWQADRRADVGAWVRRRGISLVASLAPAWLGDSLRFADADLALHLARGRLDLDAVAGTRWWSRPADGAASTWGSATAMLWIDPHLALVAAGGSYPADYAQGLPGGRYLSFGLRLASRRTGEGPDAGTGLAEVGHPSARTPLVRAVELVVPSFEVRPVGENQVRFRVRAPGAHAVELMGDFTAWRPHPLAAAGDGSWAITLPVGPGLHRMNLRVDGGAWGVPPGIPAVSDDFGGTVGILRIMRP